MPASSGRRPPSLEGTGHRRRTVPATPSRTSRNRPFGGMPGTSRHTGTLRHQRRASRAASAPRAWGSANLATASPIWRERPSSPVTTSRIARTRTVRRSPQGEDLSGRDSPAGDDSLPEALARHACAWDCRPRSGRSCDEQLPTCSDELSRRLRPAPTTEPADRPDAFRTGVPPQRVSPHRVLAVRGFRFRRDPALGSRCHPFRRGARASTTGSGPRIDAGYRSCSLARRITTEVADRSEVRIFAQLCRQRSASEYQPHSRRTGAPLGRARDLGRDARAT